MAIRAFFVGTSVGTDPKALRDLPERRRTSAIENIWIWSVKKWKILIVFNLYYFEQ